MPYKIFDLLPTPLNTANDQSASGFVNTRTLQPVNAGGLTLGDVIDMTNAEAASQSGVGAGTLYQGLYRRIQVATNATAANVKRGTAAYVVPGTEVIGALILTAGSGQTQGTYTISGSGGGGTGAIISVVVNSSGTVTAIPTLVAGGTGYTSAPTFTLVSGGTPATFQAQMSEATYTVTSRDVSGVNLSQVRGVFLNSITPGNYGWIQEAGVATVLQTGTVGSATVGAVVSSFTPTDGTVQTIVASTAPLVSYLGTAIDSPIASTLYRVLLNLPTWCG